MDRAPRTALMKDALAPLARAHDDGAFVVFEDLETGDYLQFALYPFFGDDQETHRYRHATLLLTADPSMPKARMEVTDRGLHANGPPPGIPPISPE